MGYMDKLSWVNNKEFLDNAFWAPFHLVNCNTDFCSFDKFLFANWKKKDVVDFGNALYNTFPSSLISPLGLGKRDFPIF